MSLIWTTSNDSDWAHHYHQIWPTTTEYGAWCNRCSLELSLRKKEERKKLTSTIPAWPQVKINNQWDIFPWLPRCHNNWHPLEKLHSRKYLEALWWGWQNSRGEMWHLLSQLEALTAEQKLSQFQISQTEIVTMKTQQTDPVINYYSIGSHIVGYGKDLEKVSINSHKVCG